MSSYKPIPDPFPGKGPLPANAPDFYEREELFVNVQNLLRAGECVSLVGERKAGKTSFLNYLLPHLSAEEFIPVFIDVQLINPKTDKMFLVELAESAAEAIAEKAGLRRAIKINTLTAQPGEVYRTFRGDLKRLRGKLPFNSDDRKYRLVWLIDEIEVLRSYEQTDLFTFLRPLAQVDPDFRLIVAGHDVLDTLSSWSEWSPFFNAFRDIRLEGLNSDVAQQLVQDALVKKMEATVEENLYQSLFAWTGQKPYFLKWTLSKMAEALNQKQSGRHIDSEIWQDTKQLFLNENELFKYFNHLWGESAEAQQSGKPTDHQQILLSLIATQTGPYNHLNILDKLKENRLIEGDKQAEQHLIDDLKRLEQLGFLYARTGDYTFTSSCLKTWIKEYKPLG